MSEQINFKQRAANFQGVFFSGIGIILTILGGKVILDYVNLHYVDGILFMDYVKWNAILDFLNWGLIGIIITIIGAGIFIIGFFLPPYINRPRLKIRSHFSTIGLYGYQESLE